MLGRKILVCTMILKAIKVVLISKLISSTNGDEILMVNSVSSDVLLFYGMIIVLKSSHNNIIQDCFISENKNFLQTLNLILQPYIL